MFILTFLSFHVSCKPVEFHRDLIDAYDLRQDVDYDVGASVSEKQAEEVVAKAKIIVQFIEELIIKKYN